MQNYEFCILILDCTADYFRTLGLDCPRSLRSNTQKTTFRSFVQFCIFPTMSSCHRQIMFLSIPNLQKLLQELDSFLLLEVEVLGTDDRCCGLTLS